MKRILWFVFGVITGAVALYLWVLYEIYSKPVLPTVDDEPEVEWLGDERVLWEPTVPDDNLYDMSPAEVKTLIAEMPMTAAEFHQKLHDEAVAKAKTQPVYVGEPDEVGAYQLDQWAKESE